MRYSYNGVYIVLAQFPRLQVLSQHRIHQILSRSFPFTSVLLHVGAAYIYTNTPRLRTTALATISLKLDHAQHCTDTHVYPHHSIEFLFLDFFPHTHKNFLSHRHTTTRGNPFRSICLERHRKEMNTYRDAVAGLRGKLLREKNMSPSAICRHWGVYGNQHAMHHLHPRHLSTRLTKL